MIICTVYKQISSEMGMTNLFLVKNRCLVSRDEGGISILTWPDARG